MILSYDDSPKQGNGFEVSSDLEEDYFEEYHLSNSHENVFVRHKSFRRKEKIERLVHIVLKNGQSPGNSVQHE